MSLSETNSGGVAITAINGRLDGATSAEYEIRILDLLQDGRKAMVLDLAGVDYLSSAGIRVLILVFKKAAALKLPLAIARPQASVAEVLSIAGLDDILVAHPSIEAAIQAVGG